VWGKGFKLQWVISFLKAFLIWAMPYRARVRAGLVLKLGLVLRLGLALRLGKVFRLGLRLGLVLR
jgi:hypothetical protein